MILSEKWIHSYFVCATLLGASLFLYGFFPLSYTSNERAASDDLPEFIDDIPLNKSIYGRHVSRTILMVIDAMRTDFIQNQQNTSMKYVNRMINDGSACMLNLNVEVPTVTMPRIKAMTTGTIPNFIDVVLNLGSSELHMDSVLHQFYDKGGKMVFCGDNTWVKMFPEMFLRKLENQDSLFVNDFYEGDKNITKKLSDELKRNDWELLILHFLGLDHIGHVEGPFSSKIPSKLREMDTVAMHIHLALQHWAQTSNEPPLFIITGDHGMRDSGGHGGSSYPEVNVPLIFLGPNCLQTDESFNQIDIPATLSVLFGLPIPASSIGVIIPNLLTGLKMAEKLYAHYYNAQRLLQKLAQLDATQSFQEEEFYSRFIIAKNAHKSFLQLKNIESEETNEHTQVFMSAEKNYIASTRSMSRRLADSYVNFDHFSIGIGLVCLCTALVYMALSFLTSNTEIGISPKYSIAFGLIASLLHLNVYGNSFYQSNIFAILFTGLIYVIVMTNIQLVLKLGRTIAIGQSLKSLKLLPVTNKLCIFFSLGIIFHGISTSSSSFIEEEHQIWYYLNNTIWIILYTMETRHLLKLKTSKKTATHEANQTFARQSFAWHQLTWAILFCGHLVGRRLNQTGDKWLNVADIGDWLQMEEHRSWNSLFVSTSLLLLHLTCMDFGSILTNVLTITACMLIYYYRTLNGAVYFAGIKPSDSSGTCITLFWLNIGEIAAINYAPILFKAIRSKLNRFDVKIVTATLIVLLTLVIALTHKPHNIFLIPLLLFSCNKVKQSCELLYDNNTKPNIGLLVQCVLHLWIGKQFFFYQGNSNSLATIDLNAGYIGLSSFNFFAVGLFLTVNTFSGPILSFIVFIHNAYNCNEQSSQQTNTKYVMLLIMFLIAFPFTLYVFIILAFRQHIFIWSVFSPKLLYEFYYLCLMYLMSSFVKLIPNFE